MLSDYFEPFTLLEPVTAADGCGGEDISWRQVLDFRGALTHSSGTEVMLGGRMAIQTQPLLLHEFDVTLTPGDHVRRHRDKAVYRVCGHAADMRTPAFSGLQFEQVPVERLVVEC